MKPALYLLPILAVTVVLLIRAEFRNQWRQVYLFKPLSTLLVIAMALLSLAQPGWNQLYSQGVLVGLLFSLGGDVALMFQQHRRAFVLGLALFLVAQIVYAWVFARLGRSSAWDWVSASLLLLAGVELYRRMLPNLGAMKAPVIVYILAISLMVNRAFSTLASPLFLPFQAWMVAGGALSFYISDLILAYNRFCQPWKYHRISLAFYYCGQMLIALAASFFAA